jgi:hypothetical protein
LLGDLPNHVEFLSHVGWRNVKILSKLGNVHSGISGGTLPRQIESKKKPAIGGGDDKLIKLVCSLVC